MSKLTPEQSINFAIKEFRKYCPDSKIYIGVNNLMFNKLHLKDIEEEGVVFRKVDIKDDDFTITGYDIIQEQELRLN